MELWEMIIEKTLTQLTLNELEDFLDIVENADDDAMTAEEIDKVMQFIHDQRAQDADGDCAREGG